MTDRSTRRIARGLRMRLRSWGQSGRLVHLHEIAGVSEISRRYLPMNAFDGVLMALGIITGSYFAGARDIPTVISVVAAASVSLGVSGFYGSYLSEQAERSRELQDLEEATLHDLNETDIGAAFRYAILAVATVAGLSSMLGGLLPCVGLAFYPIVGANTAFGLAWVVAVAELFLLGAFLSHVSHGRLLVSAAKLILAGGVAFGLSLLLNAPNA
ncbi:MAG TPA: hypothetical protein VFH61_01145 [Thermoleophilia bacterium]|nr:hypothetical protein [Thermoleophilia bacterium]